MIRFYEVGNSVKGILPLHCYSYCPELLNHNEVGGWSATVLQKSHHFLSASILGDVTPMSWYLPWNSKLRII